MLDNNGFIIISENVHDTGRFFGEIDGTIMDSLVQDRIYKKIAVYDYQGVCSNNRHHFSGKSNMLSVRLPVITLDSWMLNQNYLTQPFYPLQTLYAWFLKLSVVWISMLNSAYGAALSYAQDDGKKLRPFAINELTLEKF